MIFEGDKKASISVAVASGSGVGANLFPFLTLEIRET